MHGHGVSADFVRFIRIRRYQTGASGPAKALASRHQTSRTQPELGGIRVRVYYATRRSVHANVIERRK